MAQLPDRGAQAFEQCRFVFEVDVEGPEKNVKMSVVHVVQAPVTFQDVAIAAKAISAVEEAVLCLELLPIFREPPIEGPFEEKFRRRAKRLGPRRGNRKITTPGQPNRPLIHEMQRQSWCPIAGSEHDYPVEPEEGTRDSILQQGKCLEGDGRDRVVVDASNIVTNEAGCGKHDLRKIRDLHRHVPVECRGSAGCALSFPRLLVPEAYL